MEKMAELNDLHNIVYIKENKNIKAQHTCVFWTMPMWIVYACNSASVWIKFKQYTET